jgi:hypothetical protein
MGKMNSDLVHSASLELNLVEGKIVKPMHDFVVSHGMSALGSDTHLAGIGQRAGDVGLDAASSFLRNSAT